MAAAAAAVGCDVELHTDLGSDSMGDVLAKRLRAMGVELNGRGSHATLRFQQYWSRDMGFELGGPVGPEPPPLTVDSPPIRRANLQLIGHLSSAKSLQPALLLMEHAEVTVVNPSASFVHVWYERQELWRSATALVIGAREVRAVGVDRGELRRSYRRHAPEGTLVITDGARLLEWSSPGSAGRLIPPRLDVIADPMGAGDAFAVGLGWAMANGRQPEEAVIIATELAGKVCAVDDASSLARDAWILAT